MSKTHNDEEIEKETLWEQEIPQESDESTYEDEEMIEDASIEAEEQVSSQPDTSPDVAALQDQLARIQADFTNFQKRTERDRADTIFFVKAETYKDILSLWDDISRIIDNTPENEQGSIMYQWLQALKKQFEKNLNTQGITPFISVGEKLNPEKHEVMAQAPGPEWEIIEEFETGYMLQDRVLRVARVVVGNGE